MFLFILDTPYIYIGFHKYYKLFLFTRRPMIHEGFLFSLIETKLSEKISIRLSNFYIIL